MIDWEDFCIKEENAQLLPPIKEPTEEDFIYIRCLLHFGGICNEEELRQITEIVYKAYLRNKENKDE